MPRKKTIGLATGISLLAWSAMAEPFGIDFRSATPVSLGCTKLASDEWYKCESFLKADTRFESVTMRYFKEEGICEVLAYTEAISSDPSGGQLRELTDHMARQMSALYGTATKANMNVMHPFGPDEITETWLEELKMHRRIYSYRMISPDPSTGVLAVGVHPSAEGSINEFGGHGSVSVIFTISESGACKR